jgi:RNA polymerase sigma-70 factor (ECF subfamily)
VTELRELEEQLFRRESARMVAALTRVFGVHNLALAEDVVQDALCRAIEVWKLRGVPDNPAAWLMSAAKNRAIDILRRERTARTFAPELGRLLETEWTLAPLLDEAFSPQMIRDEQLRMMFSCCHPRVPEAAQLALILNILCGFGTREIANALLLGEAAVEKRISRGKETLSGAKRLFDLQDAEFEARLETVRRALYLLFNEGYHGASPEAPVRAELCREALRLVMLLLEHPAAATPATRALAAVMCLHAARLPSRLDDEGELSPFMDQDRSRWEHALVAQGLQLLDASTTGIEMSTYHLEAAIAAVHAAAAGVDETDWRAIVTLYDRLMELAPSPVVALNRAIAIGQLEGPAHGIHALRAIEDRERLATYPFYPAALGELELRQGRLDAARAHFREALELARSDAERRYLQKRLQRCSA